MSRINLLIFWLLLLFSACVKYFNIEETATRKVMVNGLLIANDKPVITVKYTYLLNDTVIYNQDNNSEDFMIKNAVVKIIDLTADSSFSLTYSDSIQFFNFTLKGYTSDKFIPRSGRAYLLKVYVKGFDSIYANTTIPYMPNIDTFTVVLNPGYSEKIVNITIKDSCSHDIYWLTAFGYLYSENPLIIQFSQNLFLTDSLFNCENYSFTLKTDKNVSNLFLFKGNQELKLYIKTLYSQISGRTFGDFPNPFQEPVVVYTNIVNGLGFFTGLSSPVILNLNIKENEK